MSLQYTRPPMRRLILVLVAASFLLAGCGGGDIAAPTAEEVVGTLPEEQAAPAGNAAQGKSIFGQQGCNGCHTFTPADSKANRGPNLDRLAELARRANQGSLEEFTRTSITNPTAYVERGWQPIMPSYSGQLTEQQISDLVAFLTQESG